MKTFVLATVACVALAGAAMAADPVKADRSGFYVGGSMGSSTDEKSRLDLGLKAGYQVGSYVRAELDVDHAWRTNGTGNLVTGNVIGQYRIPSSTLTPYVLAGVGYGFDKLGAIKNGGEVAVGNIGAGIRVAVSENVELDFRYREVRPLQNVHAAADKQLHLFSAGVDYRF